MLTIQIKDWSNKVISVINNIFSLQVEDEVNKGWKLKIIIPLEKRLQEKPLWKWYRISVMYGLGINQTIKLFDWYITDITLKTTKVEIQADNWLSYLQRRIIRADKNYQDKTISYIINEIFTELNSTSQLPITLWLNDCSTKITNTFNKWTSFYDILKYCWELNNKLVVRVLDWVLECSENTGTVLSWIWEYNINSTLSTNIADWSWKDSMDNFYTYKMNNDWSISDDDFFTDKKLIFEKYESNWPLWLPTEDAIPSVKVSRDTDWWDFNIWDRKWIRLLTEYKRLPLEYLWLIQNRKITINANWWIKAEIKVSEKYKSDTNILDLVLQNLRKDWWWGGGWWDMSNYYTKSQTADLIEWKMDFIWTQEEYEQEYWWSWDDRTFFIIE